MEEKSGDVKDDDSEFKKVQCPVCDKSHDFDNCRMFKDQILDEKSKILRKKSFAMEVIHQYHKITMLNHISREECARSVSSLIQEVYMDIYQRKGNPR